MTFTVIDSKTGEYPDLEHIARTEEWAQNLIPCDMDGFCINEDGNLLLMDECGNYAYCPPDRFKTTFDFPICKGRTEMLKCEVCGAEFPAVRERHYISRNNGKIGLASSFGNNDEEILYDTFDCPMCGCQIVVKERKRNFKEIECGDKKDD